MNTERPNVKGLPTATQCRVLPRILIIDDLYGRELADGPNPDRLRLCMDFGLCDVTPSRQRPPDMLQPQEPIAEAVFVRGQVIYQRGNPTTPTFDAAVCGDRVANDEAALERVMRQVAAGWDEGLLRPGELPWSLVLVDLCFLAGEVTEESEQTPDLGPGMPAGIPGDRDPEQYFGLRILDAIQEMQRGSHREPDVGQSGDLVTIVLSSQSEFPVRGRTESLLSRAFLQRSSPDSRQRLGELLDRHKLVPEESGAVLGHSKQWLLALRKARQAAKHSRDVLLIGETGVGKNIVAGAIHRWSSRSAGPFGEFNCAAISQTLMESELFGHVRGAFTGANRDRPGHFESAHGGTLLIDELGDMPQDMQVKLLSVLESRRVTRVGDTRPRAFDVRVITATNVDLGQLRRGGRFRDDLFYRISPRVIRIPPLRERTADIPLIAQAILTELRAGMTLHPDAVARLQNHQWPGNFRELRACIEQAVEEFPEVQCLRAEHLCLSKAPEPHRAAVRRLESLLRDATDVNLADVSRTEVAQAMRGSVRVIARLLAVATRLGGESIAGSMHVLYGGRLPRSGTEPRAALKRLLKMVRDVDDDVLREISANKTFAHVVGEVLPENGDTGGPGS